MARKTEAELQKATLIITIRNAYSLKQRLERLRFLDDFEADALEDFNGRLTAGKSFTVEPKEVYEAIANV